MSSSAVSSRLHDKSRLRRKSEQLVIRWVTSFFALLARVLPLRWLQAIGNVAGSLLFRLLRPRRQIAMANLEKIFGDRYTERERARIVHFSVRNMAKTMLELMKIPWMSDEQWGRFAQVHGEEHLHQGMAQGRGVIAITGHFGNWEAMAAAVPRLGYEISVIARDANDQQTANIINRAREMAGEEVLPRESVRQMLRILRDGHVLGILPDQHARRGGIWVPFIGHPACTATGPATLSLRTGAPIIPGFARRTEDDRLDVYLLPAIEVQETGDREEDTRRITEAINEVIGEQISRYPEQWVWMHRRWRDPQEEGAEEQVE